MERLKGSHDISDSKGASHQWSHIFSTLLIIVYFFVGFFNINFFVGRLIIPLVFKSSLSQGFGRV